MIGRNSSLSQQEVVGENFNPGLGELGEFRRKRLSLAPAGRRSAPKPGIPIAGAEELPRRIVQKATSPKMLRDSIRT